VLVRVAGDPSSHIDAVRGFDRAAHVDGQAIAMRLDDAETGTPAVVSALIAAGAKIVEVRQEIPALEDVYLHLMGDRR
jgi:hypothetical protein